MSGNGSSAKFEALSGPLAEARKAAEWAKQKSSDTHRRAQAATRRSSGSVGKARRRNEPAAPSPVRFVIPGAVFVAGIGLLALTRSDGFQQFAWENYIDGIASSMISLTGVLAILTGLLLAAAKLSDPKDAGGSTIHRRSTGKFTLNESEDIEEGGAKS